MTSKVVSSTGTPQYSDRQISAWLRGLLAVAWADGHYDPEEQEAITQLMTDQLAPNLDFASLEPISPSDLATELGDNPAIAENFLRTAVLVALADGVYSSTEAEQLHAFQEALKLDLTVLSSLEHTLYDPEGAESETSESASGLRPLGLTPPSEAHIQPLAPVKSWLDNMEVHDPRVARFICKMVPSQCPFERDITLFGKKVVHIPPMCKLNPLYDQLVGLRFRSLSYLADDCGEDVSQYC